MQYTTCLLFHFQSVACERLPFKGSLRSIFVVSLRRQTPATRSQQQRQRMTLVVVVVVVDDDDDD
jgi:hypothetical protein